MQTITLATVVTEFLDRPGYATKTRYSYEMTLLPLLAQYGKTPIELLTRPTLEAYLNHMEHLAYTTHRRHQAILQSLLNFAVAQGYLKANPIAQLKQRKPDSQKGEHNRDQIIRYLSEEQLRQLYPAVQTDARLYALVHLLHRSGARIAEILALDLSEINLENGKFQVVGKGNKATNNGGASTAKMQPMPCYTTSDIIVTPTAWLYLRLSNPTQVRLPA